MTNKLDELLAKADSTLETQVEANVGVPGVMAKIETENLSFEEALKLLTKDTMIRRKRWPAPYVGLIRKSKEPLQLLIANGNSKKWVTSKEDMAAKDWYVLPY